MGVDELPIPTGRESCRVLCNVMQTGRLTVCFVELKEIGSDSRRRSSHCDTIQLCCTDFNDYSSKPDSFLVDRFQTRRENRSCVCVWCVCVCVCACVRVCVCVSVCACYNSPTFCKMAAFLFHNPNSLRPAPLPTEREENRFAGIQHVRTKKPRFLL